MENNLRNTLPVFFLMGLLSLLPAACGKKSPDSSTAKVEIKKTSDNSDACNVVSQGNREAQATPDDQKTPSDTSKDADPKPAMSPDRRLCDEALALSKAGRDKEAREAYEDAFLLNPKNASALGSLGRFKIDDGDFVGAKEYLLQAVSADPKLGFAWNNLGVVNLLLSKGNDASKNEAVECMRQAVNLSPNVMAFQMNLGNLLLSMGRAEEAIPYLKAVSDAGNKAVDTNLKMAEQMAEKNLIERQINPAPQQPSK